MTWPTEDPTNAAYGDRAETRVKPEMRPSRTARAGLAIAGVVIATPLVAVGVWFVLTLIFWNGIEVSQEESRAVTAAAGGVVLVGVLLIAAIVRWSRRD